MGDIAKYYREQEFNKHLFNDIDTHLNTVNLVELGLWTMKNGNEIHVSDMTTSHLQNAINMIDREDWRLHWKQRLTEELNSRIIL